MDYRKRFLLALMFMLLDIGVITRQQAQGIITLVKIYVYGICFFTFVKNKIN